MWGRTAERSWDPARSTYSETTSPSPGRRVGVGLIRRVLSEALALGIRKVFILTAILSYFEKVGFRPVEKSELPQKIWAECIRCPKFPDCDEAAMVVETQAGS